MATQKCPGSKLKSKGKGRGKGYGKKKGPIGIPYNAKHVQFLLNAAKQLGL